MPAPRAETTAAVSTPTSADAGAPPAVAAPASERGRLPRTARPVSYALDLTVDPRTARFSGTMTIEVTLEGTPGTIVLHGRGLTVTRGIIVGADGVTRPLTVTPRTSEGAHEADELVLTLPTPLRGSAVIALTYEAPFSRGVEGLYRAEVDGRWYAFTDFEPTDARRAFPCFDEPDAKAPFQLTLHVPNGNVAVANMPGESTPEAGGMQRFTFAATPAQSTYLSAFAVGPFDIFEGPRTPVPLRVIAVRGRARDGALAAEAAAAMLPILAEYFGRSYPYPKLDLVAVPEFAHGAMENPGLITYRDSLLLLDRQRASIPARQAMWSVTAHELSHQWFGNLVTMRWWDDLWLNEGFATWMTWRVLERFNPALTPRHEAVEDAGHVREVDSLSSAHAIRQAVTTTSEAVASFDGTTYSKGAAVIGMLEQWLGPDVFREGIRSYIRDHAFGNASAGDLLSGLAAASNQDVSDVATGFLDRAGVPLVDATLQCQLGAAPSVSLHQSRFYSDPTVRAEPEAPWRIPVCVRFDRGPGTTPGTQCTVLRETTATLPLTGTRCPRWIHPNAQSAGYYFFHTSDANLRTMLTTASANVLDVPARLDLLANLRAQVSVGLVPVGQYFAALDRLSRDPSTEVLETVAAQLFAIERRFVTPASRPAFARWVRAMLGVRARRLGWAAPGGDLARRFAFPRWTITALGMLGDDPWALAEAERLSARWLSDPRSVDPDLASVAVPMASRRGNAERWELLRSRVDTAATLQDRALLLAAMLTFDDVTLVRRTRDLTLGDRLRTNDLRTVFSRVTASPAHRTEAATWLVEHFAGLRATRGDTARFAIGMSASRCNEAEVDADRQALAAQVEPIEGAARGFAQSQSAARQCAIVRGRYEAAATTWLNQRH